MKRNESYDLATKSSQHPAGLRYRVATADDRIAILKLMAERNPNRSEAQLLAQTDREIIRNLNDPQYWLYVADLDGQVVGLCRYFHSNGLPEEKIVYPAPSGWYGMGLLVDSAFRRQSIARFMFQNRLNCLSKLGAHTFYSIVDSENLASIKMHQEFGYEEIQRAPGFLHIKLESGEGILYQKRI
jgi:RimJ/RimL family protein N-acetyltransferase